MLLEDGIALVRGDLIVGRAHGRLPAMTSHQPWGFCQNPSTRKFATDIGNPRNPGKSSCGGKRTERDRVIEAQGGVRKLREQR